MPQNVIRNLLHILFICIASIGLIACSNNDKKISSWETNDVYHSTIISPNPATKGKTFQGPPINAMDEANTYEMFSLRSEQTAQAAKTYELVAQLTYFSNWRYYNSATLEGMPATNFTVIAREAGVCAERGCIFRELLSIPLTESFLKSKLASGFQIKVASSSGVSTILYVPAPYIKGYLLAVGAISN